MRYLSIAPVAPTLVELGYASIAHVPFLIREDGYYPAEVNRYIRARALLELELKLGTKDALGESKRTSSRRRRTFLSLQSTKAVAEKIAEFLRWCDRTEKDWRSIEYVADVIQWQRQLLAGTASASGRALGPDRVNQLINEACYFLTWASETPADALSAMRPPFYVPASEVWADMASSGTSAASPRRELKEVRAGALPSAPLKLSLPEPHEVEKWLAAMRTRFPVKALAAETITSAGLRISEANQMLVETLPPRDQWRRRMSDRHLMVWITHGIKGPKESPFSAKSVKPREVPFPLDLAERIDHYRSVTRPNQLRKWIKSGQDREERDRRSRAPKPIRLWLSESSNQPFANKQLYVAWTQVAHCPKDWHPHAGREYFAVETIVTWIRNDLAARGATKVPELTWLMGAMRDQVRLLLTPILGHVSDETTRIYLRQVHRRLIAEFGHPALSWSDHVDMDDEGHDG